MHNFKELIVWQKSIDFAIEIYKITSAFPGEEKFGLISQLRRSSVSIASNIAEGAGRNGDREFIHFLAIATGSGYEAETQLIIANKLAFINDEKANEILTKITEVHKLLYAFSNKIKGTLKQSQESAKE